MNLTAEQRAQAYQKAFPDWPAPRVFNGRLDGTWIVGNSYQNSTAFYGQFPNTVLKRIMALFPDAKQVLHLFSGTIKDDNDEKGRVIWTYDIDKRHTPSICDDVRNILKHKKLLQHCDLCVGDPPYDKLDFARYGFEPFNKAQVIRDLGQIMQKGSYLVWLDTVFPMFSKKTWSLYGNIGLWVSTNHRIRGVTIWQHV